MTKKQSVRQAKQRGGRPSAEESALIAERIIDAAWSIVLAEGPDAVTFDKLAGAASAGKATIYARFPNKVELARAMLERRIARFEREFGANLDAAGSLVEELAVLADRVSSLMSAREGRALERMVDWMDLADECVGSETRAWLYGRSTGTISGHLADIAARWRVELSEPEFAARLWLESVFGHARMSRGIDGISDWSRRHAEAFAQAFVKSNGLA